MSFSMRDSEFDIAIVAGPGIRHWPSVGVKALATICAEMGLKVGVFGGESVRVRGVIPAPGTGGILFAEDAQKRVHRIRARALVRLSSPALFPDPFPGWRSQGLITLPAAQRLIREGTDWATLFYPSTVILGTGNQALQLGSELLDRGVPEVVCLETIGTRGGSWGAKRYAGWEVFRRRFEMSGGRLLEGKPVSLVEKAALFWEFRIADAHGVRVFEVARVLSAGPLSDVAPIREYPPGSLLFDWFQSAGFLPEEDPEGWRAEEDRGYWLAGKIVKALSSELSGHEKKRDRLQYLFRKARSRLRRREAHREDPFDPVFQGKWMSASDQSRLRQFAGVPRAEHLRRPVASIECIEEVGCNLCESACPADAIQIDRSKGTFLIESKCTSCGLCLSACPSSTPVLVHERSERSTSVVTLAWTGDTPWKVGEFATLLNRKGQSLGSGRVVGLPESTKKQWVELEIPSHLVWEARGIRRARPVESIEDPYVRAQAVSAPAKVEVLLNGEKRLVRDGIPVSIALFEMGRARPEDALLCSDGSCGLCHLEVDGVYRLGCEAKVHRGMSIRFSVPETGPGAEGTQDASLCPCLKVDEEQVRERIRQTRPSSSDAAQAMTHVGEGKCHGQLCRGSFRRLLQDEGVPSGQWVDWSFPWSDWVVTP